VATVSKLGTFTLEELASTARVKLETAAELCDRLVKRGLLEKTDHSYKLVSRLV
jgi:DNA-binding IclR family transcriptional regulator